MNTAKRAAILLAATGAALSGAAGTAFAVTTATGSTEASPGVLSGNLAQRSVDVPIQAVGNSLNAVGILNPAFGNTAAGL